MARVSSITAAIQLLALIAGVLSFSAGTSRGQQSSIGVNLAGDWLWADAIRQARPQWATASNPWADPGTATVDSNNWPTEDCSLVVWEGHAYNDGTYALSFNGKATISDVSGYSKVLPSSTGTYNAATNTTTATLVITDTGSENFSLVFTNTQRTASSATNTGVTNVHLYRPVSEGATTSYSPTTLFTNQTLAMSANFSVTRFMDEVGVIDSTETNWSDRPLPGAWNQNPLAYEYVVAYGNASNTDIYVNVPLYATSTYITDLANLIKYGSDGVNPYTSVQTNPVYAPLNPGLHVYLEYSNEVWNSSTLCQGQNYNIVVADQTANNAEWSILNYDGIAASNLWYGAWRRIIYQAKLISDDFRAVYGDSAMPPNANATVRPLDEFQAANGQATGSTQLQFLDNYFNNSDGVTHVATPHPVNYFLWGGGGATYYNSNDDTAATTDALFDSGIPGTGYSSMVQTDSALVKGYGLKRVAYEGGWGVYNGTNGYESTAGTAAALAKFDPRATTAQTTAHTIFQQSGGDLNIFYTSSSWAPTYIWSLTDEIFNLTTPLFQAVTNIDASQAPAITYGNTISGTSATTLAYGSQLFADSTYNDDGLPNNGALGWLPLISTAGVYQISLNIYSPSSSTGKVRVTLDGQTFGSDPVSVPESSSASNVVVGTVNLAVGQHGLIVDGQYTSNNSYSGNSCTFTSVVLTPIPVPQISGQPQNKVATLGNFTSFSVTASGTGLGTSLTYQWEFNGAPLTGQTTSTLSLTNLTQLQAGNYTVLVTNAGGTTTSATATLTVQATYTQWSNQYFSSQQQNEPTVYQPTDIPENDGVSNLLKYLFDINPSRPMTSTDRASLPVVGTTTNSGTSYLTLTYHQNSLLTGVTVNVQTSPDLQTWTTLTNPTITQTGTDSTTGDPIMQVQVAVTGTKQFIRLNVTSS